MVNGDNGDNGGNGDGDGDGDRLGDGDRRWVIGGRRSAVVVGLVARGRGRSFVGRRLLLGLNPARSTLLRRSADFPLLFNNVHLN